jgi:hypothetical protein
LAILVRHYVEPKVQAVFHAWWATDHTRIRAWFSPASTFRTILAMAFRPGP